MGKLPFEARVLSHTFVTERDFDFRLGATILPLNFCINCSYSFHVRWVPCHHGMARPQVVDGGYTHQVWRVAANI
jgi:hypothetical protein